MLGQYKKASLAVSVVLGMGLIGYAIHSYHKSVKVISPKKPKESQSEYILRKVHESGLVEAQSGRKLSFGQILKFIEMVGTISRANYLKFLDSQKGKRRDLLREQRISEYMDMALSVQKHDEISERVLGLAARAIGLTPKEIDLQIEFHQKDPEKDV